MFELLHEKLLIGMNQKSFSTNPLMPEILFFYYPRNMKEISCLYETFMLYQQ